MFALADYSRRRFLLRAASAGAGLTLGLEGRANQNADPPAESESRDFITAETQRAIDRGLGYLAATQFRDGSFGDRIQFHGNVAVTSLAALAFMSAGHQPSRGAFGPNVVQALLYVLSREQRSPHDGFLHHSLNRQVGMYDHGFGTLFLAEIYGMVPDRALQKRLKLTIERAIRLIETSQSREGGWRYDPEPQQADVSMTVCQIMALRAARNAGFAVNKQTVDLCVKYVRSCQNLDGGYSYFSGQGGSAFPRSAAGLAALYSAGIYDGKEIERTLKYLQQFKPNSAMSRREVPDMHWYYGQYYAAQAMWTAALRQPRYWNEWFPALRDDLLARVRGRADGSWPDHMICNHYATAMALIMLQIPNNYLPILQK
jgi:prenyltransferase beta subunit